jgi:tRNA (guanine10-N2)-methyltransferase
MLDDILDFAAISLVDNGRLSFWMPTANDEDQEIKIPQHPSLEITSVCTQAFNRCKSLLPPSSTIKLTF